MNEKACSQRDQKILVSKVDGRGNEKKGELCKKGQYSGAHTDV